MAVETKSAISGDGRNERGDKATNSHSMGLKGHTGHGIKKW
jgi:hypothetical protein